MCTFRSKRAGDGDLARAKKLDPSFVARLLRLTPLAPDIVEAILDARQAPSIQRQRLMPELALDLEKQRATTGPQLSAIWMRPSRVDPLDPAP